MAVCDLHHEFLLLMGSASLQSIKERRYSSIFVPLCLLQRLLSLFSRETHFTDSVYGIFLARRLGKRFRPESRRPVELGAG